MSSISVLGATGFVGARVVRQLRARGGWRVTGTSLRSPSPPGVLPLDLRDARALAVHARRAFDVVLVLAGTKDVAGCERDPGQAFALNARPAEILAETIRREGLPTRVVYLSTDYVFDGERGLYRPDDRPEPRTAYGRSKLAGERAVLEGGGAHKVVRSGAVLGRGAHFFDWLVAGLASDREIPLFDDCWNSPTPIALLADLLCDLVERLEEHPARILHFAGAARMSRLELGRRIAALRGTPAARLVPERRAAGGPLFQRDLSLVPSDAARPRAAARTLEDDLAPELGGA